MKKNLFYLFFISIAIGNAYLSFAQSKTSVITTVAGSGMPGYGGDQGGATDAGLNVPSCLAFDSYNNLYINDQRNNRVRKVDPTGIITTFAGTGVLGFNGDGKPATATKLWLNWGVAVDGAGNVYITDQVNFRVRKVNTAGIVSTIAGTGISGFTGDTGPASAAMLGSPLGVAADGAGNVYIGDPDNKRIRKINTAGIITTVAGKGTYGFSGDGAPATAAELSYTWGLAIDGTGNLFICDGGNNCIRKVDPSGIITTIAGTGAAGYTGDGGYATAATLNQPTAVFVHSSGDVYISDYNNNCIRKIDASGIITTIAGTGAGGYNGDNIPATAAHLFHPISVTMDRNDDIYVADMDNARIRKISPVNTISFTGGRAQSLTVCQNTVDTTVNLLLAATDYLVGLTDTWSLLSAPSHGTVTPGYASIATGKKDIPVGLSYTPYSDYTGLDTFSFQVSNGTLSDTTVIYVSVKTPPVVGIITGDTVVCVGSAITLANSVQGGVWRVVHSHAVINGIGQLTGKSGGDEIVLYIVSNICGIDTAEKNVSVNPLPDAGTISGPSAFCNGTSVKLSETKPGGIWTCSNGLASVDAGVVTGLYPGKATIRYTVSDSVCSSTVSHGITIDTFPYAGVIIGAHNVCVGAHIILTNPIEGGTWQTSRDLTSITPISEFPVSGNVFGVNAGLDTISYSIANSCGVATTAIPVMVHPLPEIPIITRIEDTCIVSKGYSGYQWMLDKAPIPGATLNTVNIVNKGDYSVQVSNQKGCSATSQPVVFPGCNVNDIHIFPNPASSLLYIQWCKKISLRLMSVDGKVLYMSGNTNKLDIGMLPDGTYLLNVYDEYGSDVRTERITKLSN